MSTEETKELYQEYRVEEYLPTEEPFYVAAADEIKIFEAAYQQRIPVLLKGPTGCGKTRFLEYMAHRLGQSLITVKTTPKGGDQHPLPLVTIACHEDLTGTDLVGRYLLKGGETAWIDGPLARAAKVGAICYLDEIVEARKDTTVIIHPLTDHRRILPVEKKGEVIRAHDNFLLVLSYNPGYQSALKDLKQSTRQRFIAIEFDYLPRDLEKKVIAHEGATSEEIASDLAVLGEKMRHLKEYGLQEGASTRLLIYTAKLIESGISPRRACQVAVVWALSDDPEVQQSLEETVSAIFK
ncbi:MAG: CbbQ/NirQ/NorQ/GpvN family protein [Dehalococcoidia bacterium]|nr:MAG: CbbQ/NirQ/NorQ/GpvN family protein [Dehalococcoidia bacterium]